MVCSYHNLSNHVWHHIMSLFHVDYVLHSMSLVPLAFIKSLIALYTDYLKSAKINKLQYVNEVDLNLAWSNKWIVANNMKLVNKQHCIYIWKVSSIDSNFEKEIILDWTSTDLILICFHYSIPTKYNHIPQHILKSPLLQYAYQNTYEDSSSALLKL